MARFRLIVPDFAYNTFISKDFHYNPALSQPKPIKPFAASQYTFRNKTRVTSRASLPWQPASSIFKVTAPQG